MLRKTFVAAIAMLSMASSAIAGQCGYEKCWGAVGVGPNGAWGYAIEYSNENAAWNRVQSECSGNCDNIHTFYNACGAIAMASDGSWGFDWGYSRAEAENNALGQCYKYGSDCSVRVWGCSP